MRRMIFLLKHRKRFGLDFSSTSICHRCPAVNFREHQPSFFQSLSYLGIKDLHHVIYVVWDHGTSINKRYAGKNKDKRVCVLKFSSRTDASIALMLTLLLIHKEIQHTHNSFKIYPQTALLFQMIVFFFKQTSIKQKQNTNKEGEMILPLFHPSSAIVWDHPLWLGKL